MKKVFPGVVFLVSLGVLSFWMSVANGSSAEKKLCVKNCYKSMYQCFVKGSNLPKGACFSENVGQMLMCIDSKGVGSLKKKRVCFGAQKSCQLTCK